MDSFSRFASFNNDNADAAQGSTRRFSAINNDWNTLSRTALFGDTAGEMKRYSLRRSLFSIRASCLATI